MALRGTALAVVFGTLALTLGGCAAIATSGHSGQPRALQAQSASPSQIGPSDAPEASPSPEDSFSLDTSPEASPSPTTASKGAQMPAVHRASSPAGTTGRGGAAAPAANAAGTPSKGTGLQLSTNRTSDGSVALTFDDGPGAATPELLALLRQYQIKATFCVVGQEVKAHPDMVRQIVADGHTLCNHTWSHDEHLGNKSPDAIRADLQRTNDAIHAVVPNAPIAYFRHPGGNFTQAAVDVCRSMGMQPIGWIVDPRDWDLPQHKGSPAITSRIEQVIRADTRPGLIVLSHDGGGDRSSTLAAYRDLLPELKAKFTLKALPTK